uniref:Uncharacterized protein n=1 Tax=Arundo donax TaxID=35708 RepID=A0A0A9U977_ARUDO
MQFYIFVSFTMKTFSLPHKFLTFVVLHYSTKNYPCRDVLHTTGMYSTKIIQYFGGRNHASLFKEDAKSYI